MKARFFFAALLTIPGCVWGQRVGVPTEDLAELNVEELFQVQVTSVGRKAQQLSRAPAAVYVLTAEDIKRTGATSIPEALQWAPGITALSIDGRAWALSSRGAARMYSDKILVMVDGRSLYTPLFSGVIWDFVNVPLENVERIEVIRGPGSVMWGPNAVNGVINIITRQAKLATPFELSSAAGNELHASAIANWSGRIRDGLTYRVWGKGEDRNPAYSSMGGHLFNGSYRFRDSSAVADLSTRTASAGLRVDAVVSAKDQLMFQADGFGTGRRELLGFPVLNPGLMDQQDGRTSAQGGSAQMRWTRTRDEGDEQTVQFTFDNSRIVYPFVSGDLNNIAVNYERRRKRGEYNELFWGAGYQQYSDDTASRRFVGFTPASRVYRTGNIVLRDEWQPVPGKLMLSAGARLDYSSETQFEFQPTVRLLLTPSTRQSFWLGASRVARTPNRFDRDMHTDGGYFATPSFPVKVDVYGSRNTRSEIGYSAEAGHRFQARQRWSIDSAVFWSYYPRLRLLMYPALPDISFEGGMPSIRTMLRQATLGKGRTYGAEFSGIVQITQSWRMIPSYSYINEQQWTPVPSETVLYDWLFRSVSPSHQGLLRSQHTFRNRWQFDWMARARSRNAPHDLPGVLRGDMRVGWRPTARTELSGTVRNVTGRQEFETFSEAPFVSIPTRRTFVFRLTVQL